MKVAITRRVLVSFTFCVYLGKQGGEKLVRDATQQRSENLSSSQEVCLSNSGETVRDPFSKQTKQVSMVSQNREQTLPPWKLDKFNNFLRTENSEPDASSLQTRISSTVSQNRELEQPSNFTHLRKSSPND